MPQAPYLKEKLPRGVVYCNIRSAAVQLTECLHLENNPEILKHIKNNLRELGSKHLVLHKTPSRQPEAITRIKAEICDRYPDILDSEDKERRLSAGDECLAKYSGDGSWYPAPITSIGGAVENRVYSIVFKGYNTTELAKGIEIEPLPANYANTTAPSANKRKLTKVEEDEKEREKKDEKKLEVKAAKAKEQTQKQASWQKFAKKSEKKGVHIAGISGTSIVKTPDNPLGKVGDNGVTGSGKGMTEVAGKIKHKFEIRDEDGQ